MKVVVALDKFKGSLTAARACEIVAGALAARLPHAQISQRPMADGGDGTAAVIHAARPGGEWIERRVTRPLPGIHGSAMYLYFPAERLAVIEMAAASGLALLRPDQRDPGRTTTFGTGELIRDARERGAQTILLGVGGSATVDGGVGAAMALGWQFLDAAGKPVGLGGGELSRIATLLPGSPACDEVELIVLCDVDNPLCGPHGAARVFGPQKGATPAAVEQLEAGLANLAGHFPALAGLPGAGAAGGLGFGAAAFLGARLVPGVEIIMDMVGLEAALTGADWVITGEGCFDAQSLRGKVVAGVARQARRQGAKVAVLAGSVALANPAGIELALATRPVGMELAEAVARAEELLADRARELAQRL